MKTDDYTELQLDALRELANVGSGKASVSLSTMVGRPVDVTVPSARALPLADAVDAAGPSDSEVWAVIVPIKGDLTGLVLLLFGRQDAETLCRLLGVEIDTEWGLSALMEVGNILGSSYAIALGEMTGTELEPLPPQAANDMLGAIVASVLAHEDDGGGIALLLDSDLIIENEPCSLSFMLVPDRDGMDELLRRMGVGA